VSRDLGDPTRASLLCRLRFNPGDQAAWADFVRRYGPLILHWCRHWTLQDADAHDLTQTVLVKLCEKLRGFDYDPTQSFRAYVKTLTRYAWCDFLSARQKVLAVGTGDTVIARLLDNHAARDDLEERVAAAFEQALYQEATEQVRQRVEPHTWEAFRLTALEGLSGAETAARLGIQVATVFKAKSKVRKLLQDVVQALQKTNATR